MVTSPRARPGSENRAAFQMDNEDSLLQSLSNDYGLVPESVISMKTVIGIVQSSSHRYIWKYATEAMDERKLNSIFQATRQMNDNGIRAAGPLQNLAGGLLTTLENGKRGYLQPWLQGRHVNLKQRNERCLAIRTLAQIHGIVDVPMQTPSPQMTGETPYARKLQAKRQAFYEAWSVASHRLKILQSVESQVFSAINEACQASLEVPPWRAAGEGSAGSGYAFCHRDLAPHNLIFDNESDSVGMIDFDLAGFDDPFADVVQFINHYVFLGTLERSDITELIDSYRNKQAISPVRFEALQQLLRFPDILIRATLEWVKSGCPANRTWRVIAAIEREYMRLQML